VKGNALIFFGFFAGKEIKMKKHAKRKNNDPYEPDVFETEDSYGYEEYEGYGFERYGERDFDTYGNERDETYFDYPEDPYADDAAEEPFFYFDGYDETEDELSDNCFDLDDGYDPDGGYGADEELCEPNDTEMLAERIMRTQGKAVVTAVDPKKLLSAMIRIGRIKRILRRCAGKVVFSQGFDGIFKENAVLKASFEYAKIKDASFFAEAGICLETLTVRPLPSGRVEISVIFPGVKRIMIP